MWIKFLKSKQGLGYFPGDQVDVDEDFAEELIAGGFATIINEEVVESDLPEDLKGREILIKAGLHTKSQVLAAKETLTDIKGIGKATAEEIVSVLTAE